MALAYAVASEELRNVRVEALFGHVFQWMMQFYAF
jgi:hypothetical protein